MAGLASIGRGASVHASRGLCERGPRVPAYRRSFQLVGCERTVAIEIADGLRDEALAVRARLVRVLVQRGLVDLEVEGVPDRIGGVELGRCRAMVVRLEAARFRRGERR